MTYQYDDPSQKIQCDNNRNYNVNERFFQRYLMIIS